MGFMSALFGEQKGGFYIGFTCSKCNTRIENKVHTATLSILRASIREPVDCPRSCGNSTKFRYDGFKYYDSH